MTPLERFEALVLNQTSAAAPWEPVTDYSYEARTAIEGKHPQLIKDVFQPARVLDAGCGVQGHLVRLLRELGLSATGFDKSIEWPTRYLSYGCVTWPIDDEETDYPDLVICREVLEHLTVRDVARAVRHLCGRSSRYVYVTTRFAKHPQHILDVDTSDDLDPTHISMLHQDFLRVLFVLEGFKRRADLEARMDWQQKGRCLVYERV